MAIKILKVAPNVDPLKKVTCGTCESELEYAPVDVQVYHNYDIQMEDKYYHYIVCPVCSAHLRVERPTVMR